MNFEVQLGKLDEENITAGTTDRMNKELGFTVQELTPELAQQLGYQMERGVVVAHIEPNSLAAMAGLTPGTLITEVNQRPVPDVKTFEEVISEAMKGDRLLLLVRQGGHSRFIVLRLDD
jgi:serine protease Do